MWASEEPGLSQSKPQTILSDGLTAPILRFLGEVLLGGSHEAQAQTDVFQRLALHS